MRADGRVKSEYPEFVRSGDLAELIGVVLGDGHVCVFPRTESLRIVCNSGNPGEAVHYVCMMERVFGKRPTMRRRIGENAIDIQLYEKHISRRLGVKGGDRSRSRVVVPRWVLEKKEYMVRYLRGLYEAEGCFCVHLPTSTHKLFFSNHNPFLLGIVYRLVKLLGFHPHKSRYQVQVSRKDEVYRLMELLQFRKY